MDRFNSLIENARKYYAPSDPSHDFSHIMRVIRTCKKLTEKEQARLDILIPAAIFHDIINLPKNHPDRSRASELAAAEAAKVLAELGYENDIKEKIAAVITEHSFSAGHKPSSLESAILQDADRLDALGAIGIMRTVACGCSFGAIFYDVHEPFAKQRSLNDRQFTIDHFFVKLFALPSLMNTESGRNEANKRVAFMKTFLAQLQDEITDNSHQ